MNADLAIATDADLPEVLNLYERVGYEGGVADEDTTFVARVDGAIVGAVRLSPERGLFVLRGMYVDEDRRGRGHRRRSPGFRATRRQRHNGETSHDVLPAHVCFGPMSVPCLRIPREAAPAQQVPH